MNEKLKELYSYIQSQGATDLSIEEFYSAYGNDPIKAKDVYDYVRSEEMTDLNESDFFNAYFGQVKKKEDSEVTSQVEGTVSPTQQVVEESTSVESLPEGTPDNLVLRPRLSDSYIPEALQIEEEEVVEEEVPMGKLFGGDVPEEIIEQSEINKKLLLRERNKKEKEINIKAIQESSLTPISDEELQVKSKEISNLQPEKDPFIRGLNASEQFLLQDEEESFADLGKVFNQYGFEFEEAVPGRNALLVKAANGKELLVEYGTEGLDEESKNAVISNANSKLQKFLTENRIESEIIRERANKVLKKDSKKVADLLSKEEFEEATKTYNKTLTSYQEKIKDFEKKKNALKDFEPKTKQEFYLYNSSVERLNKLGKELMEEVEDIASYEKEHEALVGKYTKYQAEKWDLGSISLQETLTGISTAIEGFETQMSEAKEAYSNFFVGDDEVTKYFIKEIGKKEREDIKLGAEKFKKDLERLGTTVEAIDKIKEESFVGGALLGTLESLAPMAAAAIPAVGAALSTTGFFYQAYSGAEKELSQYKGYEDLGLGEKMAVKSAIGLSAAILEKIGLDNAFRKTGLLNRFIMSAFKDLPKDASKLQIEQTLKRRAKQFLKDLSAGAAGEGLTGGAQEIADIGIKSLYNTIKDVDVFKNPQTISEFIGQVLESAGQEAIGGLALGSVSSVTSAVSKDKVLELPDDVFEMFENLSNDKGFGALLSQDLKIKIANGSITKDEAQAQLDNYHEAKSLLEQVPKKYSVNQKKEAISLLSEKKKLQKEIEGKDPSLVENDKKKIAEIEEKLKAISSKTDKDYEPKAETVTEEEVEQTTVEAAIQTEAEVKEEVVVEPKKTAEVEAEVQEEVEEDTEVAAEETVGQVVNRPVMLTEYGGKVFDEPIKGNLLIENQRVSFEAEDGKIYDIGNKNDLENKRIDEVGIKYEAPNVKASKDGALEVGGNKYTIQKNLPTIGVEYNTDGDVTAVSVKDESGKPVMFKGTIAEEMAYQILLNEAESEAQKNKINEILEKDEEFKNELRQAEESSKKEADTDTEETIDEKVGNKETKAEPKKTAEGVSKLRSKFKPKQETAATKKEIDSQVENAKKALSKVAPEVEIIVSESEAEYKKATKEGRNQNSGGTYVDGKIYINPNRANKRTVAHEVFHALLLSKGRTDKQAQAITERMMEAVKKNADQELLDRLEEFSSKYENALQSEESIAELMGILAEGYPKLNTEAKSLIKRWLDRLAKIFGIKPLTSDTDIINFLNTVSGKIASGKKIKSRDIKVLGDVQGKSESQSRKQISERVKQENEIGKLINPTRVFVAGIDISDIIFVNSYGRDDFINSNIKSLKSDIKFAEALSTTDEINTTRLRERLIKNIDITVGVFKKQIKRHQSRLIRKDGSLNNSASEKIKDFNSRIDLLEPVKNTIYENLFSPSDLKITNTPQSRKQIEGKPSITEVLEYAKQENISEQETIEFLKEEGYTDAEINEAIEIDKEIERQSKKNKKRPPSAKKTIDAPKRKKVTVDEYAALKDQLRYGNKLIKKTLKEVKAKRKEISATIKELRRTGKISVYQAAAITNKLNSVNLNSEESVDKLIEYIDNVFKKAEYFDKVGKANTKRKVAIKNIKSKIGTAKKSYDIFNKLFKYNAKLVPENMINDYLRLSELYGKRKPVLKIDDINSDAEIAKKLNEAIAKNLEKNEDKLILSSLMDIFYQNAITANNKVKVDDTLKAMKNKNLIDDDQAKIIKANEENISIEGTKTLEQKKEELIEGLADTEVENNVTDSDSRNKANDLLKMLKNKDIKELLKVLSKSQLENLPAVLENISNGIYTQYANDISVELEAENRAQSLAKQTNSAKTLPIETFFSNTKALFGELFGSTTTSQLIQIRNNPLKDIGTLIGSKTTELFDKTFGKSASTFSNFHSDLNKVMSTMIDLQSKLENHYKDSNEVFKARARTYAYLLQKEFESNKEQQGNKVFSAADYIQSTIDNLPKDTIIKKYDADRKLLNELLNEVKGKKSEEIFESFSKVEKDLVSAVEKINLSNSEKMIHNSSVVRGSRVKMYDDYVYHNVAPTRGERKTIADIQNDFNRFQNISTKAGTGESRTTYEKAPALNFDIITSTVRGSNETLLDYHVTNEHRIIKKTLNRLEELSEEGTPKAFAEAINEAYDQALRNAYGKNYQDRNSVIDYLTKVGYQTQLAKVPRAIAELASNVGYAIWVDPKNFKDGVTKYADISYNKSVDYMEKSGSTEASKYAGNIMAGKNVDAIIKDNQIYAPKASGEVMNKVRSLIKSKAGRTVTNLQDVIADKIISTPDKIIGLSLWTGNFMNEMKRLNLDVEQFENSKEYREENKEKIAEARTKADRALYGASASQNQFVGVLKNKVDPFKDGSAMKAFKYVNSFFTNFAIFEYSTFRDGVLGLIGNKEISRAKGARLIAGTMTRMATYNMTKDLVMMMFGSLFGEDEEEETITKDDIVRNIVGAATALIVGRNFGTVARNAMNIPLEYINENYGQSLRGGENYDPYEHAIGLSYFNPTSKELADEGIVYRYALQTFGPLSPLVNTANNIAKNSARYVNATSEREKERAYDKLTGQLLFETLAHTGKIPFASDIKTAVFSIPTRKEIKKSKREMSFGEMEMLDKNRYEKVKSEFESKHKKEFNNLDASVAKQKQLIERLKNVKNLTKSQAENLKRAKFEFNNVKNKKEDIKREFFNDKFGLREKGVQTKEFDEDYETSLGKVKPKEKTISLTEIKSKTGDYIYDMWEYSFNLTGKIIRLDNDINIADLQNKEEKVKKLRKEKSELKKKYFAKKFKNWKN